MTEPLPLMGPRVVLRRLAPRDLAPFQAYRHDAQLGRYQGWTAQTDADALAFIEAMAVAPLFAHGEWLQLAIADRHGDTLLGDIGLHVDADGQEAEIGFTLGQPAQGRGLATEAVGLALRLLWRHSAVARIVGITDARNLASVRLLERLGLRYRASRGVEFKGQACVEHVHVLERQPDA